MNKKDKLALMKNRLKNIESSMRAVGTKTANKLRREIRNMEK